MPSKKLFVLDTSVLIHDPKGALQAFEENVVVIPIIVVGELDGLKKNPIVGPNAREVLRQLDTLRLTGDIIKGVPTQKGGTIRFDLDGHDSHALPAGFDRLKPDNIILLTAMRLKGSSPSDDITIVSKDTAMRIMAQSLGLISEDYKNDKVGNVDSLWSGQEDVEVDDSVIDLIHRLDSREIGFGDAGLDPGIVDTFRPNLCSRLIGRGNRKVALALWKKKRGVFRLVDKPPRTGRKDGLHPRNEGQSFAMALLADPEIKLVTLSGKAGTGKSLMALLSGWQQVIDRKQRRFGPLALEEAPIDSSSSGASRILVFRPTHEIGSGLGFLPGTMEEKLAPWQRPTLSALQLIADESGKPDDFINGLIAAKRIEVLSIAHVRGSTESHAFMVIDDCQNFTPLEVKTLITRVGEGTKVVITGDMLQVDVSSLDAESNGMAHIVAQWSRRDFEIYGHLRLTKGERSELAELAADTL
ncbi:MAG: PhoH family protein [Candidatus Taylorbacteria bacterium]|nr:PhoH family protein [Candidatus Taylorbacteria bacterium]